MSPVRIQRQRRKGFKMPEGAVYVGRGTRFGNPWKVERFAPVPGDTKEYAAVLRGYRGVDHVHPFDHYREAAQRAVAGYHVHLTRGEGPTSEEIATLKGKNLACWCAPGMPCHADVLLKLANPEETETPAMSETFTKRRLEQITIRKVGQGTSGGTPNPVPAAVLTLFRRSDEHFAREHEEWLAKHKQDLEDRYEASKDDWQKRTEALPDRYRARLERFLNDPEKGEEFRKGGMSWGYELIVCELACLYGEHGFGGGSFNTEPDAVQEFARRHGTSGTQHEVAKAWAKNPEVSL